MITPPRHRSSNCTFLKNRIVQRLTDNNEILMYLIVQKITTKALSIAETSVPSNDIKEQHSLEIKNALKQHVESSRLKKEKSLVWKLISE